jgi:predicted small integral membrane protein
MHQGRKPLIHAARVRTAPRGMACMAVWRLARPARRAGDTFLRFVDTQGASAHVGAV